MPKYTKQSFDFGRAEALRNQIKGKNEDIKTALADVQTKVATSSEWWKGESQEGFVKNFESTKKEVAGHLESWLHEYEVLMQKVEQAKEASDKAIAGALRK
jgi:uncharacterized protein YukE